MNSVMRIASTTAILIATYTVLLVISRPEIRSGQHQWQDNLVVAQNFVSDSALYSVVIVGSSLSTRLKGLPSSYYNLACGGMDSITGMTVVLRSGARPKMVLLEAQTLMGRNLQFIATVFSPWAELRDYLPLLQERYKPMNLFLSLIGAHPAKPKPKEIMNPAPAPPRELVEFHARNVDIPVTEQHRCQFVANLEELADLMARARARGILPVLVDFPVPPEVQAGQMVRYQHRAFLERFPPSKFHWIFLANADIPIGTTDGLHLSPHSGHPFAKFLVRQVDDLIHRSLCD